MCTRQTINDGLIEPCLEVAHAPARVTRDSPGCARLTVRKPLSSHVHGLSFARTAQRTTLPLWFNVIPGYIYMFCWWGLVVGILRSIFRQSYSDYTLNCIKNILIQLLRRSSGPMRRAGIQRVMTPIQDSAWPRDRVPRRPCDPAARYCSAVDGGPAAVR